VSDTLLDAVNKSLLLKKIPHGRRFLGRPEIWRMEHTARPTGLLDQVRQKLRLKKGFGV
jgi:hypothetical protein